MISTSIYTEKPYHYTYWITNTKEQKHYIGVRSSDIHPSKDLGTKYFSSSKDEEFMSNQKEHPELYAYKVCGMFSTRKLALGDEIYQHNTHDVARNPRFYNKSKQTDEGFDSTGFNHNDNTKEIISSKNKMWYNNLSIDDKAKISIKRSISAKNQHLLRTNEENKSINEKISSSQILFWETLSVEKREEISKRMSISQKNTEINKSDEEKYIISKKISEKYQSKTSEEKLIISNKKSDGWKLKSSKDQNVIIEKRRVSQINEYSKRTIESKRQTSLKCKRTKLFNLFCSLLNTSVYSARNVLSPSLVDSSVAVFSDLLISNNAVLYPKSC
jgi:hypothetical protein